jgi:N-acyl-D-aspartate/D-glutamate deacylase
MCVKLCGGLTTRQSFGFVARARVRRAEGYRQILVNGQVTLEDGKPTGSMPGKLLRYGQ